MASESFGFRDERTVPKLFAKIKKLSRSQRKKVEARAAELIAEEMTLREFRKTRKLTQVRMAEALGITQDSVSAPRTA